MRKIIVFLMLITLVVVFSLNISSSNQSEYIEVYRNLVKLEVNGSKVSVDNFLFNGTTYVPLRAVAELLKKDVGWNFYTETASINDVKYERELLSKLLPAEVGFVWKYEGFAEYSHEMKIDNILEESLKRRYIISGEVGDPSDGESTLDRRITMRYTIEDNKLVQEKSEKTMLDSKFDKITVIKAPLVAGTFWTETLIDKHGGVTTINAFIQKVEVLGDGSKQYTVRYDDINSSYYEERIVREGLGVISFEKLLELQDSSFPVTYFLFNKENVKDIQLKLYFPDNNADKLRYELRNVMLSNSATARAAVEALIEGPSTNNLIASIPQGSRLLNIYIQNDICIVDFSKEFIVNHPGGSAGELMTIYSIVNTLTEFSTIKGVQILIDGKLGETLGNIVFNEPIERRQDLIH